MLDLVLNNEEVKESTKETLEAVIRDSARKVLEEALKLEVSDYINRHKDEQVDGKNQVVRNGSSEARKILTKMGEIEVQAPRVNDKRDGERFISKILPPYLRKSPEVESLIPALYLSGASGGKIRDLFKEHFGQSLSPASVGRLKAKWADEFKQFRTSPITDRIVYAWADGVHLKIRLGDQKSLALLVVIGVTDKGKKVLLAVEPGYRESKESWLHVLRSLQGRGMTAPLVAVADGAAGFWSAMRELEHFKNTKEQRCWVHKIKNVLDKCPKSIQIHVKSQLHEMMHAPTEEAATKIKKSFVKAYQDKYLKMTTCLEKDWAELITFYKLPAASWTSLRTTNPIESSFATVKLRMKTQRGSGSANSAAAMAFKLLKECEKKWLVIRGHVEITNLLNGVAYKDGVALEQEVSQHQVVA